VSRRALVLVIAAFGYSVIAPAQQTRTSAIGVGYTTAPQTPSPTDGLLLGQPTWGLFIGISDYGERAKVQPTPAHTLGAALMYEAFFNAAKRVQNEGAGIPARNYFKTHKAAVCAAAFSPKRSRPAGVPDWIIPSGDDRSRFVTGAADGTVVLWSIDPVRGDPRIEETLTTTGEESCAVAFSPDGWQVAIAERGRDVSVRVVLAPREATHIIHPASVCSVAFNSAGTQILTSLSDGTARVSAAVGGKTLLSVPRAPECAPVKPGKQSCADAPAAAFSPKENLVLTSSCGAIRIWPVESPAVPTLIGKETGISEAAFSPDGSQILTVTDHDVSLRDVHPGGKLGGVLSNSNGRQARFSPDGSYLATVNKDGAIEAYETGDMKKKPRSRGRIVTGVRSLQFSDDARYIALRSGNGSAWLADVNGLGYPIFVPRPEEPIAQDEDDAGFAIKTAIELKTIPPGRKETPLESVGLSPDGRYVVAGYKDGTVGIHPGMSLPELWAFREEDEVLLADHRFDNTPLSVMAIWYLRQLHGGTRQLSLIPSESATPRNEPAALRVGSGKPVTRERVFAELHKIIRRAEAGTDKNLSALLVVYVAAHGWVGPDGRNYFLPSDSDASQPNTWIAYEDFLKPIEDFVSTSPGSRGAIVMLDACQIRLGKAAKSGGLPKQLPENLLVIESTSPDQYAWHWTEHMDSKMWMTTLKSKTQFGIQRNAKPVSEIQNETFPARMSVFPVASLWALADLIEAKSALDDPDKRVISVTNWINNTRVRMAKLLDTIPEVSQTGRRQQMQVRPSGAPNFALFQVAEDARKK